MKGRTVLGTLALLAVGPTVCFASSVLPPHLPPTPSDWQDGLNHNHNEAVNLENVLDRANRPADGSRDYDAFGSWCDFGAGLWLYYVYPLTSGLNDPEYVGHGYIDPAHPVLYQYEDSFNLNAPDAWEARQLLDQAFSTWQAEINGTRGYRNPNCKIGFAWERFDPLFDTSYHISINWLKQPPGEEWTDTDGNGRWDPGETYVDEIADGYYTYKMDPAVAWVTPSAFPTHVQLTFVDGWYDGATWHDSKWYFEDPMTAVGVTDFYTTAMHELGHLLGLADLYNLYAGAADPYDAFPNSLMGYYLWTTGLDAAGNRIAGGSWDPYQRTIDLGSLQGGIDLYSIAIPEPLTAAAVLVGLATLGRYLRRRIRPC